MSFLNVKTLSREIIFVTYKKVGKFINFLNWKKILKMTKRCKKIQSRVPRRLICMLATQEVTTGDGLLFSLFGATNQFCLPVHRRK